MSSFETNSLLLVEGVTDSVVYVKRDLTLTCVIRQIKGFTITFEDVPVLAYLLLAVCFQQFAYCLFLAIETI